MPVGILILQCDYLVWPAPLARALAHVPGSWRTGRIREAAGPVIFLNRTGLRPHAGKLRRKMATMFTFYVDIMQTVTKLRAFPGKSTSLCKERGWSMKHSPSGFPALAILSCLTAGAAAQEDRAPTLAVQSSAKRARPALAAVVQAPMPPAFDPKSAESKAVPFTAETLDSFIVWASRSNDRDRERVRQALQRAAPATGRSPPVRTLPEGARRKRRPRSIDLEPPG